jgi:hypothetical protein
MLSRNKPELCATGTEQFSSTRIASPLSVLVDGDIRMSEATNANARIDSGDHCYFIDGEWNCVGERCSSPSHHLG